MTDDCVRIGIRDLRFAIRQSSVALLSLSTTIVSLSHKILAEKEKRRSRLLYVSFAKNIRE